MSIVALSSIRNNCYRIKKTMAGLSNNVLNMKFMQRALEKNKKVEKEKEIKKIRDSSEWVLPNRSSVQKHLKTAVNVQTVGYGSIASLTAESEDEAEVAAPETEKVCDLIHSSEFY